MNLLKLVLISVLLLISGAIFAIPKQVIIIRHADKLLQDNKSPTLSAKGYIRAVKFAFYYLQNYNDPDYIFAKNPFDEKGKEISFRELQTLAPIVNILEQKHPDKYLAVFHPYTGTEFMKLANEILNSKKYNLTTVLICWNHAYIPDLAKALGVTQDIPAWQDTDFDSVFILDFPNDAKKPQLTILRNQYTMSSEPIWENIALY